MGSPPPREPAPPTDNTPARARWIVGVGGSIVLAAAAAISFQGLSGLGRLMGIDRPWLLPIAIDAYASICTLLAIFLPAGHTARRAVIANARIGLAMSVLGNIVDRGLTLGHWTPRDIALTFISSWPSVIVERVLHLQGKLAISTPSTPTTVQASAVNGQRRGQDRPPVTPPAPSTDALVTVQPPAAVNGHTVQDTPPSIVHKPRPSTVRVNAPSSTPSSTTDQDELIVHIGRTVYEAVKNDLGKRPPEQAFRDALARACAPHVEAGRLPETYRDPSTSTAKRVRKQVEDRFPELSPLHLIREAS